MDNQNKNKNATNASDKNASKNTTKSANKNKNASNATTSKNKSDCYDEY